MSAVLQWTSNIAKEGPVNRLVGCYDKRFFNDRAAALADDRWHDSSATGSLGVGAKPT